MSRKLDALFAERVLGLEVEVRQFPRSTFLGGGTVSDYAAMDGWLPSYTSSLDAAWAGVEKRRGSELFTHHFSLSYEDTGMYRAEFIFPRDGQAFKVFDSEPALALVKACLLAVGVSQEEIDSCA